MSTATDALCAIEMHAHRAIVQELRFFVPAGRMPPRADGTHRSSSWIPQCRTHLHRGTGTIWHCLGAQAGLTEFENEPRGRDLRAM